MRIGAWVVAVVVMSAGPAARAQEAAPAPLPYPQEFALRPIVVPARLLELSASLDSNIGAVIDGNPNFGLTVGARYGLLPNLELGARTGVFVATGGPGWPGLSVSALYSLLQGEMEFGAGARLLSGTGNLLLAADFPLRFHFGSAAVTVGQGLAQVYFGDSGPALTATVNVEGAFQFTPQLAGTLYLSALSASTGNADTQGSFDLLPWVGAGVVFTPVPSFDLVLSAFTSPQFATQSFAANLGVAVRF